MKPEDKISQLKKEIENKVQKIVELEQLLKIYPDLEIYYMKHLVEIYRSSLVNDKVNKVAVVKLCNTLEARPYLETEFGKIYSSPSYFIVGSGGFLEDDSLKPDWDELLRKHNISENVIKQIYNRFNVVPGYAGDPP